MVALLSTKPAHFTILSFVTAVTSGVESSWAMVDQADPTKKIYKE
jgi:hypothetical protein